MHEALRAVHFATEDGPESLMPKANAKHGNLTVKVFDGIGGNAIVFERFARSGGNDEVTRIERDELIYRDLVIAEDFDIRTEFAEVLDEVVGEGVVVIY